MANKKIARRRHNKRLIKAALHKSTGKSELAEKLMETMSIKACPRIASYASNVTGDRKAVSLGLKKGGNNVAKAHTKDATALCEYTKPRFSVVIKKKRFKVFEKG